MLVMRTIEHPTHPLGKLVRSEKPLRLYDFALGVNPSWLDVLKPRALLRKKATYDPHSAAALFDAAVVRTEPAPYLLGDVPGSVVPDEKENLLADGFESLGAPRKKPCRYGRKRPAVHEPDPSLSVEFGQIESVAGYGLRSFAGIVFGDRPLDEARRLVLIGPGVQSGQRHPAPPALVREAHRPLGIGLGDFHQSVAPSFFLSYKGSGEVIQRFARLHLTESRR